MKLRGEKSGPGPSEKSVLSPSKGKVTKAKKVTPAKVSSSPAQSKRRARHLSSSDQDDVELVAGSSTATLASTSAVAPASSPAALLPAQKSGNNSDSSRCVVLIILHEFTLATSIISCSEFEVETPYVSPISSQVEVDPHSSVEALKKVSKDQN